MMKAAVVTRLGGPEVFEVRDVAMPEAGPGEVLIRVASIDVLVSSGLLPIGYGLAGIAADRLGAAPVFVLGGVISAAVIALGLLHPAIRVVD